jgi:molecular chaperone GrpE (heat shock protein)
LAERKKEQNRAAAQRYRSKKTCTQDQEREEIDRLEILNAEMRAEQKRLAKEIANIRAMLLPPKNASN